MPGANGGLNVWPSISDQARDTPSRNSSISPIREHDSEATLRSHYDARTVPLVISQQTSMSSVRDMALRKSPSVLRKSDKSESRPLKSALKRYPSDRAETAHPQFLYPPEYEQQPLQQQTKARESPFQRFSAFFTRRDSSRSSLSRTPSTTSTISTHFTAAPVNAVRRKRSIIWEQPIQQSSNIRGESAQAGEPDTVRAAKLASGDVYEAAKKHIRRPPKGIKNWFEAEDVSSDDDPTPVEAPAHDDVLPSILSPFSEPGQRSQYDAVQDRSMSQPDRISGRPSTAKRNHSDGDTGYFDRAITPKASEQGRRGQQSRKHDNPPFSLTSSTDGGETDLSGRDSSLDIQALGRHYNHATTMNFQRPAIPARKLQSSQIASHNAYHVNDRPRLLARTSERTEEDYTERPTTSSRRTPQKSSVSNSRSQDRASPHVSSGRSYNSSGGVSVETDQPHTMEVTEEEMVLLEMMREKRAAMQRTSYSEGYRQALKREHEQLMQRRMLAQQTALRILRSEHDIERVRPRPDMNGRRVEDKEIRKLNKLRQQEMDRMQRLEKFLAMDPSMIAAALDESEVEQSTEVANNWPLAKQASGRSSDVEAREGRSSARPPSFSRRDVYNGSRSRSRHEDNEDVNLALAFPVPPIPEDWRYDQDPRRRSGESERKTRQITQDSEKYTREVYTMKSHAAVHAASLQTNSRQHIRATSFLRSISDYQPAEDKSIVSSIEPSLVQSRTPSSLDDRDGGLDSRRDEVVSPVSSFNDRSSPEVNFALQSAPIRQAKNIPLNVMTDSNRPKSRNKPVESVSDDVLAAWASLGGQEGMLHSRRARSRVD